jgi:Flp pilus assembly protein TadB
VRLQQFEQRRAAGGGMGGQWQARRDMLGLRMLRMVVGVATVALVLVNIFFLRSLTVSLLVVALVVLWIALTIAQIYYVSRMRKGLQQPPGP